jgi:hypothetical protein
MTLPKEKHMTVEDFKARLASVQPQRRATIEHMREDARAKVFGFVEREYLNGYSLNQIGDKFLGIAKRFRMADTFVGAARETLAEIGWTPKRERA